jgi:hypothetical protein
MCQKQSVDLFRHLVGSIVADAQQSLELVGGCDEFTGPFGSRPSNRVVVISPDVQGRHFGRTHRRVTNSPRPIPCQRRLHSLWVANDRQVRTGRGRWYTILGQARPQPIRIVGQNVRAGVRFEECLVVPRSSPLLTIRHFQRPCGRKWMRTGQDSKRCQPLMVLIGDLPCETGTPIMANKMEASIAVTDSRYDIEGVADQTVHTIVGRVGQIRSSTFGISALVRGYGEITRLPHRVYLGIPEEPRCAETMQHEDERCIVVTIDRHIEHHAGCRSYI